MERFFGRWSAVCAILVLCCASAASPLAAKHKSLSRLKAGLEGVRDSAERARARLKALRVREKSLTSKLTGTVVPKTIPSIQRSFAYVRCEIEDLPAGKPGALHKKLSALLAEGHGQVLSLVAGSTCSDTANLDRGDVRQILSEFDSKDEVLEALDKVAAANQESSPKTAVLAKAELKKIRFERKALVKKIEKCDTDEKMILAEMKVVREGEADEATPISVSFQRPVPGRLTSGFGLRMHPLEHVEKNHDGIDLAAAVGDPVKSFRDGKVVFAGEQRGYGMIVIVQHSDDLSTAYAHLSEMDVEVGDEVSQGQVLGKVGMTGNSTGPHLHFEVRENNVPVDPAKYLSSTRA